MTLACRPATAADRDFIIGAWESSYQDAHTSGAIPHQLWASVMRPIVAHYLDRPYAQTIVAADPSDPGGVAELAGFICGEPESSPPIVYYCYVIQSMRRFGIARRLFRAIGIDPARRFHYLCSTPVVPQLQRSIPSAQWKPNRARYSLEARR